MRYRFLTGSVVAVAVALVLSAPASAKAPPSGLYGTVMLGPVTPVCVAEKPCSRPAVDTRIDFVRNGAVAGRAVTGNKGRYRVALAAGTYLVRIGRATESARRIEPLRVRVLASRWTRQNFSIDTGIR